jgi:hypothetical protein
VVANSQRQFLHFYSDVIPESQFLYVQVIAHPNRVAFGVSFSLNQPAGFNNADWQLIENHFKKLNLLDRYQHESNDEISACFGASKSHVANGGKNVRNFIKGICDDEERKLGSSHWRVVLKRRLAVTDDFIHHVINEANNS